MKNYNRALIIDADPVLSFALQSELCRIIPEVSCAANGSAAIELFYKLHPDIIFIDTDFPEARWQELIRILKSGYSPLIVFLTAAAKSLDGIAIEYQTEEYLQKPLRVALDLFQESTLLKRGGKIQWLNKLGRGLRRHLALFKSVAKRSHF